MTIQNRSIKFVCLLLLILAVSSRHVFAADKLKALIIDGQNNHDWSHTTPVMKWILEDSGRFTVDVSTSPSTPPRKPATPKGTVTPEQQAVFDEAMAKWKVASEACESAWQNWHPHFQDYDVVIGNYNGHPWSEAMRKDFVDYVSNGGGFVSVHAADNSFPEWPEYNEMIGLGGWGNRNEKSGPMLRLREGKFNRDETPGSGGSHGAQHEFLIVTREPEHPILKGLPAEWRHATDELYSKLRGPATNLTVLATAFAAKEKGGTGEDEPMLMVINFGKGHVFHTTLGHSTNAMLGLGFQITLARGAEWVATGKVTLPAPEAGVLGSDKAALRTPKL